MKGHYVAEVTTPVARKAMAKATSEIERHAVGNIATMFEGNLAYTDEESLETSEAAFRALMAIVQGTNIKKVYADFQLGKYLR